MRLPDLDVTGIAAMRRFIHRYYVILGQHGPQCVPALIEHTTEPVSSSKIVASIEPRHPFVLGAAARIWNAAVQLQQDYQVEHKIAYPETRRESEIEQNDDAGNCIMACVSEAIDVGAIEQDR